MKPMGALTQKRFEAVSMCYTGVGVEVAIGGVATSHQAGAGGY